MTQKNGSGRGKILLAAIILLAVTAAAIAGAMLVSGRTRDRAAGDGGYPVYISEVMTYNVSCPGDNGLLCDWVELTNGGRRDFDLSGYKLSDTEDKGKYTFPAGTVIPAGGQLLVWCSSDVTEEGVAPFALKRDGGEPVCLMTHNEVVLDSVLTVAAEKTQSLVREGEALIPSDEPTPGYPNTEAGRAAWLEIMAGRSGGVLKLSEIMSSNSLYAGPDGIYCDWIEIYNTTDSQLSLAGYKLSDRESEVKYEFPEDAVIPAYGYRVVYCSREAEGDFAPFALLSDGGESVYLTAPDYSKADSVELPPMEANRSYAVGEDGSWALADTATPGYPNTPEGYEEYCLAHGAGDTGIVISEIMARNSGVIADSDGDFSDWIELENRGDAPAELGGWYLSDDPETPNLWKLPDVTLEPGEQLLIFASGKNRREGELHTDFSLTDGDKLLLSTPLGLVYDEAEIGLAEQSVSLCRTESGEWSPSIFPTPGYENSGEGYELFCQSQTRESPLVIYEAMSSNSSVNVQEGVGACDWAELKNISDHPVELSDYTLSDSKNEPAMWSLPSGVLQPGESVVYYCSGNEANTAGGFVHTNFALSRNGEGLYLYKNGMPQDWVYLHHIPSGGSMGRMDGQGGFFYFTEPSTGGSNSGGIRRIAPRPTADMPAGVYEGVENVTVALSGEGEIRYTLDGSVPTRDSSLYREPFVLTETTVIRARCFADGALDGRTLSLSYIINEGHTLPVTSLVANPDDLFGGQGVYSNHENAWLYDWEREGNVSFYEEGGSFSRDCGIQIHGQTSRRASEKRSMKVMFRGDYEGPVHYDVFGDGRVLDFSSLILRGSLEDNYTSYMRDEIFAELAMSGTDVIAQNYRYTVLYINGEYWGIYSIREHLSNNYFATHYHVDKDTVDRQNGTYRGNSAWSGLMDYAQYNNMNDPASYAYMEEHLDIDEMIEWLILQCYSGNIDVYGNVRFYSSPDYNDGRYMYGLVDMDLTMMGHDTYTVGFDSTGQFHGIIPCALKNNPVFREAFLTRLGEMLADDLSEENMNRIIDSLIAQIEDEVPRDLERWYQPADRFSSQMNNLKSYTAVRVNEMTAGAQAFFGMTPDEVNRYFADVHG